MLRPHMSDLALINKKLLYHAVFDVDEREVAGEKSNPKIVQWLRAAGITWGGDHIPWCSVWVYDVVGRVPGAPRPESRRAAARSWLRVGSPVDAPIPGDVLIFDRGRGRGHVGFFLRERNGKYLVLGGNQDNRVWPKWYDGDKLLGIRRLFVPLVQERTEWGSRIRAVQDEGLELFERKNADYGNSFEAHGVVGTLIRSHDKMQRLMSITKSGTALVCDESMRDTLLDLHNYAAMSIALMDGD